jgi:hypothetical protein
MQSYPVGVYYSGQDFSIDPPAFFVRREIARQWLTHSRAWSIHHGRDIALQPDMEQYLAGEIDQQKLAASRSREQSCIMGERVMDANVAAEIWARRMVRSWNPAVARSEHLRSLKRYQEQSRPDLQY